MSTIYLQKIEMSGIKGIENKVSLDFSPSKNRESIDQVDFFGLNRSKYEFGAIKNAFIIGQNGSGKSSIAEAIFSMYTFFKNPNMFFQIFGNDINFYNRANYIKELGAEWKSEFVFKHKDFIYKFYYDLNVMTTIKKESLKFTYTKDGSSISPEFSVFDLENFKFKIADKVDEIITLGNAARSVDSISGRKALEEFYPDHYEAIIYFIRNAMSMHINRSDITKKNRTLISYEDIPNTKLRNRVKLLYSLFDDKIKNIKNFNGEPMVEYQIAKNRTELLRNVDLLNIMSEGGKRCFDLVDIIIDASLNEGKSVIIDEIEDSLHESLAEFLTALVMDRTSGQSIFVTHNLNLIDSEALDLRPDQIFIIKTSDFNTSILRGDSIAPTNKHSFTREYIKNEFLDNPSKNIKEKVWDEFEKEISR